MSTNETPENPGLLTALAHNIHDGQVTHQASVGLLHHLAAGMDATLKKLEGDAAAASGSAANKGSQLVYRGCVAATGAAEAALAAHSDGPVKLWLSGYRKIIEGLHGKKANSDWEAAGFAQGSTAVPSNHAQRLALLTKARAYLAANASYEASLPQKTGAPLPITAARALELQNSLQAARTLVNTRTAEQVECKKTRDADLRALFEEVSSTIAELRDLLADDDARWEVFGLNIPANPNPPEGVTGLTLSAAGPGRELAAWPHARRATIFRVFLKREGVDADFVNIDDPEDLEYVIKGLTPGGIIHVYIVPSNAGGDGPASPTVTKTVGA